MRILFFNNFCIFIILFYFLHAFSWVKKQKRQIKAARSANGGKSKGTAEMEVKAS